MTPEGAPERAVGGRVYVVAAPAPGPRDQRHAEERRRAVRPAGVVGRAVNQRAAGHGGVADLDDPLCRRKGARGNAFSQEEDNGEARDGGNE